MKTLICTLLLLANCAAQAATLPGIPEFIEKMTTEHNFKRAELEQVFARAQHKPSIIEAISRPSTIRPWPEYRASFVNAKRVKLGLVFWEKYRQTLRRAEKQFGVPQEIIVAIIGVETVYGENMGSYRVLDALTTLAFDYPRRADFFRSELEHFLLLARAEQFDLLDVRGSYAGAIGIPQFMPSSHRKYAIDYNHNQKIDLRREARDAIGSVGNYFQGYGWRKGEPVAHLARLDMKECVSDITTPRPLSVWVASGVLPAEKMLEAGDARLLDFTLGEEKEFWLGFNNFDVITRYNNSDYYAMSVFQLAEALKAARAAKAVEKH